MTPTIAIALFGILVTTWLSIYGMIRSERRSRQQDQQQQLRQVEQLLQTMVVEKIDAAFAEIAKHERRITDTEKSHSHLLGFLQGKGCSVPDFCAKDLEGVGK
jgi:type II secretory pathway pseudopilin PulG